MARRAGLRVLVATDGSSRARAAVRAAVTFPWARAVRARVVVARGFRGLPDLPGSAREAIDRSFARVASDAQGLLSRRWPDVEAVVVDALPVEGILAEAKRFRAQAVVMGTQGHGMLGRLLLGSVSRGVVRSASCPVLVVRGRPGKAHRLLLGLDGSVNSRRAVAFVARLNARAGGRVTVLRVVEPMRVPSLSGLPAAARSTLSAEAKGLERSRLRAARREVAAAARRLRRSGWAVRGLARPGVPLSVLLDTVKVAGASVVVVGARGVGGVQRLLLGSVAEGLLDRAPVSVLIVK